METSNATQQHGNGRRTYPPGYRFVPTDVELIREYLQKKIERQPLPIDDIKEINLMHNNPTDLTQRYPRLGENEWYFFTPRFRKYLGGDRPDRRGNTGHWKPTGCDNVINFDGKPIGLKRTLVYYEDTESPAVKTDWIMNEYRIYVEPPPKGTQVNRGQIKSRLLDEWILCKIHEKAHRPPTTTPRRQRSNGSAVDLEDGTSNEAEAEDNSTSGGTIYEIDNNAGDYQVVAEAEMEAEAGHEYYSMNGAPSMVNNGGEYQPSIETLSDIVNDGGYPSMEINNIGDHQVQPSTTWSPIAFGNQYLPYPTTTIASNAYVVPTRPLPPPQYFNPYYWIMNYLNQGQGRPS